MGRGARSRLITRGSAVLLTLGTILVLISPVTASTAFLIRLKNGRELRTNWYWEEANRIMFYTTSGGVFGIQKSLVQDIKALDSVPDETVVEHKADKAPAQDTMTEQPPQEAPAPPPESSQTSGTEKAHINRDEYRDKKRELQTRIDQAAERYRNAATRADPQAQETARLEMLEITKQVHELADELKQKNGGMLPEWWGQL